MMRILEQADQAELERFLLTHLDSSMFLLSNVRAAGMSDNGQRNQGCYSAAFDNADMCAVVAHYWNGLLVLQAPTAALKLSQQAVRTSGRSVHGVLGPADQVALVRDFFTRDSPGTYLLDSAETLYSLPLEQLQIPNMLASGSVTARLVEADDIDLMTAWRIDYAIETLNAVRSQDLRDKSRQAMELCTDEQRLWVLESDGERVACSAFNATLGEAVQIGGVWTPPGFRGRGFARCVVAASLLDAHHKGLPRAVLFTGNDNIAAQRAYEAIGFTQSGNYHLLLITP